MFITEAENILKFFVKCN